MRCGQWEGGLWQLVAHHVARGELGQLDAAVVTLFPAHVALVVEGYKLEDDAVAGKFGGVELDSPLVVGNLGHLKATLGAPVAQSWTLATQHQVLVASELRCAHVDDSSLAKAGAGELAHGSLGKAIGECAAVEVAVLGQVEPVVIDGVTLSLGAREHETVRHRLPLMAHLLVATIHAVVVVDVTSAHSGIAHLASPSPSVGSGHLVCPVQEVELAVVNVQHYLLSKDSLIVKIEN